MRSPSIDGAGGRSTIEPARPVRAWLRFCAVITARAALAIVFGLTFWAVAPILIGWHTTTVMTGSMEPAIQTGDLVVSRMIDPPELRPGQVVLVNDPDHHGRLRLHRLHAVDGSELITKGDANPEVDSSPVGRADVLGIGALRVPWIGIPIPDARDGDVLALATTLVGLCTVIAVAFLPAIARTETDPPEDRPDLRRPTDDQGRSQPDGLTRARVRPRTFALVAALTVALIGAATPAHAASFSSRTQSSGTLQAGAAQAPSDLTCQNNVDGTVTLRWAYSGERPSSFDVLVDGHGSIANLGGDARSIILRANSPFSFGTTSVVRVRTNLTPTWTATGTTSRNVTTITLLWVGVARCG